MNMTELNSMKKTQSGNAVIIVLVVLALVAVGALAYLSGQMTTGTDANIAQGTQDVAAAGDDAETDADAQAQAAQDMADAGDDSAAAEAQEAAASADDQNDDTQQEAAAEQATSDVPEIEPGNPVVAMVGDEEVMRLDVLNFITQLPPNIRQLPIAQLFPLAQEQVINAKVVEMNIDTKSVESSEEVQKKIAMAKEQIIRAAYLEQEVAKKLTDKRLKQAYDEFVKAQPDVEEVKAAHILVDDEAVAKDIIAKLNDGAEFADLAKEHSKDNTADNGGELGYFAKGDVVPEFADMAFSMKKGAVTKEPVKTDFGYHVIKVEDKRQRPKPTFEEAKPFLEKEVQKELLEEMLADWRDGAKIKKYDINGNDIEPAAGE
ncbi:MAG: rotamase [Micavibrio sp.]|nr:rotamase [Micavibrio sp.]|tara:strand:- start:24 stop:1148 length:1125 start_codon:yes stop_codon:yes gene_type:complete